MASTLSSQVAALAEQVAALATLVSAQAAAPVRTRTASPSVPLSTLRERAAGGTAPCGKAFATAKGLKFHAAWHDAK